MVSNMSFSGLPWLSKWWAAFNDTCSQGSRDFWMFEVGSEKDMLPEPVSHARGLQTLKFVVSRALDFSCKKYLIEELDLVALKRHILRLSWHSARVTLLNAAVHAKKSSEAIALQANWTAPGAMVLKYTRDKRSIPLEMVNELVAELKGSWIPAGDVVECDSELLPPDPIPAFFLKIPKATRSTFKIEMLRWHVSKLDDPTKTQCGIATSECEPMGSVLPDIDVLCTKCAAKRADLTEAFVA